MRQNDDGNGQALQRIAILIDGGTDMNGVISLWHRQGIGGAVQIAGAWRIV